MEERRGDSLKSGDTLSLVAQMKEAPIQFRIVADRWPVEFRSLAQGKTTIFLEHIDYFDAIARRCRCVRLLLSGSLLLFQPFILLFLGNESYGMANRVRSAAMPGSGVGYKEKYRSEERRVGKECRSRWWPYH